MRRRRIVDLVDINELNKNMFMSALAAAREMIGSTVKLSIAIGYEPRRLQVWTHGTMPHYSVMQDAYPKLVRVANADEEELERLKKLVRRRRLKIERAA